MSDKELKQYDETDEEEELIKNKVSEAKRQYEITKTKNNFNAKKAMLAERAAEFVLQYGKDDYRAQIMLTFLDVALQMEDAVNLINDVGMAMDCITDAMKCMDGIMEANELLIDSSMARRYGFFQRLKRKRKLQRAINNNAGRMKQICDMLVGNQKLAISITNALRKSSLKMQDMMQKNTAKQKAKELKKNPAAFSQPSKADELVAEIVRSKGGNYEPDAPAPVNGASDGVTKTGGGTTDISDVL